MRKDETMNEYVENMKKAYLIMELMYSEREHLENKERTEKEEGKLEMVNTILKIYES